MATASVVKIENSVIIGTVEEVGKLLGLFRRKASVVKIEGCKIVLVARSLSRAKAAKEKVPK